jgi:hypothetical protein
MDEFFNFLIEHKKLLKEKEDGTKGISILKESLDDNEQKWVTIGQNLKIELNLNYSSHACPLSDLAETCKIEKILGKMNEKCREVTVYKKDTDNLVIEFNYKGSMEEINEADENFREFNKKQAILIQEAQESSRQNEEEKKQHEAELQQFSEFVDEMYFPDNWEEVEDMSDTDTKLVDVIPDSKEWIEVEEKMNVKVWERYQYFSMCDRACKDNSFKILKLQRVQNKTFWRRYASFMKNLLKSKYKDIDSINKKMETKNLFYSTHKTKPEDIICTKQGFDKNYCHPKGFLGRGFHFAENADYWHFNFSKMFCHRVNPDDETSNEYKMLMIRAITGFYERMKWQFGDNKK